MKKFLLICPVIIMVIICILLYCMQMKDIIFWIINYGIQLALLFCFIYILCLLKDLTNKK